jgi:hypothetical protein
VGWGAVAQRPGWEGVEACPPRHGRATADVRVAPRPDLPPTIQIHDPKARVDTKVHAAATSIPRPADQQPSIKRF